LVQLAVCLRCYRNIPFISARNERYVANATGKKRNTRAGPALRLAPAAAAVVVRAAVAAVGGLAVIAAVAAVPALAAQQEPSATAGHAHPPATRQQALTGRVAHSPRWAHLAADFDYSADRRKDNDRPTADVISP
jgi:hypothetical protein